MDGREGDRHAFPDGDIQQMVAGRTAEPARCFPKKPNQWNREPLRWLSNRRVSRQGTLTMPDSDFANRPGDDRKHLVTSIRKGFAELAELLAQLHRCLVKRERTRRKLERACRAFVKASESSDLRIARQLLAEALDAAKDGLAEIDGPDPAARHHPVLETTAD
jgi:hypothetical protein